METITNEQVAGNGNESGNAEWDGSITDEVWSDTVRRISEFRDQAEIAKFLQQGIDNGWVGRDMKGNDTIYFLTEKGADEANKLWDSPPKVSQDTWKTLTMGVFSILEYPDAPVWVGPECTTMPFPDIDKYEVQTIGRGCITDSEWNDRFRGNPKFKSDQEIGDMRQELVEYGWVERKWNGKEFENRFTPLFNKELEKDRRKGGFYGSDEHKQMLYNTIDFFEKKGCPVKFMKQGGPEPVPDAVVERGDFLLEFSQGRKVNIEIEFTSSSKPARILQNLAKSKNHGRMTAYVTDLEENAEKILRIINRPYREYKNGKYEYYMKEPGQPFIPETEFNGRINSSDYKILMLQKDGGFVEYVSPNPPPSVRISAEALKPHISQLDALENYLAGSKGAHSLSELCRVFGKDRHFICAMLGKLIARGTVLKEARGMYTHKKWVAFNN
jgi:hypothetical protein